ncbi:MAG: prepilin-type N-terminal cleavage/methylation domain-containing protein [Clostridiales bacterium]
MIQKIRNKTMGAFKNKKGFTLVEVIVVLVILAILAAILVPKLIGWIDQAKEKTATGEAHLVLSALQADASERYGQGGAIATTADAEVYTRVNKYLKGDIDVAAGTLPSAKIVYTADAKVTGFEYKASNDKYVTYTFNESTNKGKFTTSNAASK